MILQVYQTLKDKVSFICEKLKLFKYENTTGQKLKIESINSIFSALARPA